MTMASAAVLIGAIKNQPPGVIAGFTLHLPRFLALAEEFLAGRVLEDAFRSRRPLSGRREKLPISFLREHPGTPLDGIEREFLQHFVVGAHGGLVRVQRS